MVPQEVIYREATTISDDSELELMKQAANEKAERTRIWQQCRLFAWTIKLSILMMMRCKLMAALRLHLGTGNEHSSESVVYHMDDESSGSAL